MRATVAAIVGIWIGGGSALGCGSAPADAAPGAATPDGDSSEASAGDPSVGSAASQGGECGDAGLNDPTLYDAGSSEEALADYARRRTACSLTVQLTRRGKPLTLDYAIK